MKCVAKLLVSLVIILMITSCFDPEEFPETPYIEFESISYRDTETSDSLILKFRFEDGDGNIGLNSNDIFYPYHDYSLIADEQGNVQIFGSDALPPYFSAAAIPVFVDGNLVDFERVGPWEDFPASDFGQPYSCENYEIIELDTFMVKRNEFGKNLFLEFFTKSGGQYNKIDFNEIFENPDCELGDFDGRIPWFDPNGKEGIITYSILSGPLRLAFLDDSVKIDFYVVDRELNRSNVASTPDFLLRDITQ